MKLLAVMNQKHHSIESIITISSSTNDGVDLYSYFVTKIGRPPVKNERVTFLVPAGVDIVAQSTTTFAINSGTGWLATNKVTIENRGRILGRGGSGGLSARMDIEKIMKLDAPIINGDSTLTSNPNPWRHLVVDLTLPATPGGDGGDAISNVSIIPIDVINYGLIAGGGGGGGGAGAHAMNPSYTAPTLNINGNISRVYSMLFNPTGPGCGGGAPYGKASFNNDTEEWYKDKFGIDIKKNQPTVSGNDIILYSALTADVYTGKFTYPVSTPKLYKNNIYAIKTITRDKTRTTAKHKNTAADHNAPYVVEFPYQSFNMSGAYTKNLYFNVMADLPGKSGDDYLKYNSMFGYNIRYEEVSMSTMLQDGAPIISHRAKDGTINTGGRGGANHWSNSGYNKLFVGDKRELKPSEAWRISRIIKVKPTGYLDFLNKYGNFAEDNGTHFRNNSYTTAIDYYKDVKGGDGGDVGENGLQGALPPKAVIGFPWHNATATTIYPLQRIWDASLIDNLSFKTFNPAQGGKAGYIKKGAVTIVNKPGGLTKGRN